MSIQPAVASGAAFNATVIVGPNRLAERLRARAATNPATAKLDLDAANEIDRLQGLLQPTEE